VGSAFTKLSVRAGWDGVSALVRDLPSAETDTHFCIPSVVARVESSGRTEVLIGAAAASQLPGERVTIIQNWKAGLFSNSSSNLRSPDGAGHDPDQAVRVAVEFFNGLHQSLGDFSFHRDVRELPVRVSVPKLEGGKDHTKLIRQILLDAGWNAPTDVSTVFEPESNAIGILSRGRNATWTPAVQDFRPLPERSIAMQRMLEPGIASAFSNMRDHYGVLVTDIGAFTTDLSFVKFDSSFQTDNWNRPQVTQISYELGVSELDPAVFKVLSGEAQSAISAESSTAWEVHKRRLYAGKASKFAQPSGGTVIVGDGPEAAAIAHEVAVFAGRVCAARAKFRARLGADRVHTEFLTGGGSQIPIVRAMLGQCIVDDGGLFSDLQDPREPDQAVKAGVGPMTTSAKERRVRLNNELVRGASAVGGASVFFE
jgi:hypothetical protein